MEEEEAKLEKIYHEIFDPLTDDRKYILNQMCSMFEIAAVVYRMISLIEAKKIGEVEGACEAGTNSQQCLIHYNLVKEALGADDNTTCEKIDAASKYLKDNGWYGLPEPVSADGTKHYKTAAGVLSDLKNYINTYNEILKVYRMQKEEKGVAR